MVQQTTLGMTALSQQKVLRALLKENTGSSLYGRLGINKLYAYKDFTLLYQAFCRAVNVQSPRAFVEGLVVMGQEGLKGQGNPAQVYLNTRLLGSRMPVGLTQWRSQPVPVGQPQMQEFLRVEKFLRSQLAQQGIPIRKNIFYLPEAMASVRVGHLNMTSYATLVDAARGWASKKGILPRLSAIGDSGGSRMRWFSSMLDQLQQVGGEVEVLVTSPSTLIDFGLYASQQAGRFMPLRELCPNLKVLLFNGYDVAMERVELGYLLNGLPGLKWAQWMWHGGGCHWYQSDLNLRQRLQMVTDGTVFYEFIPMADILPDGKFMRNYRRFFAGQVEAGQEYAVVISNMSGLLAVSTGQSVKILQKDPLLVQATGPVMKLNGLGEGLREEGVVAAVGNINTALQSHGVFVRHVLLGHDVTERQPLWVMELSRPVAEMTDSILESMAKRLHAELDLRYESYRTSFREAKMKAPKVMFVGMGSFAAAQLQWSEVSRFDHSPDATLVRRVMAAAWQVKEMLVR